MRPIRTPYGPGQHLCQLAKSGCKPERTFLHLERITVMKNNNCWAVPAVLLAMLSVQGGASIAKYLFPLLGPAGTSSLRIGLAGILLAAINRPDIRKFSRKNWVISIVYGLSIGFMNLLFYYGIQRIPLGLGVTVEFIGPLALALLTSRRPADFLWAFLAGTGIVLIVPWNGGSIDPVGLLFVFAAGILWALYIVAGRLITRDMKSSDAVTAGMCIALLFILPFGFFSGELDGLSPHLLLAGLGVAVFSSALPFTLDLFSLKRIPPRTFSVLQSLQPAFGALSGLLFLGERLSMTQWIAIACVILASLGATLISCGKNGEPRR